MLSACLLQLTGKHTQNVATAVRTSFIEVGGYMRLTIFVLSINALFNDAFNY